MRQDNDTIENRNEIREWHPEKTIIRWSVIQLYPEGGVGNPNLVCRTKCAIPLGAILKARRMNKYYVHHHDQFYSDREDSGGEPNPLTYDRPG